MSRDQQTQAVHVNNVPRDQFEAMVTKGMVTAAGTARYAISRCS